MKSKFGLRIVTVATASSLLLTAACGSSSDGGSQASGDLKGQKLVFVNYGGESIDAAKKGWLDPFSKETGVQFATDSPTDPAKIKAMVEGGKTSWDVVDIDIAVGQANCGTLFEKRSAEVDMSQIDPKYITDDCGVPIITQTVGLVYNKKLYGDNPPTSTEDFMDTKKFPGKRIFFNYPTGTVEPLLAADGASPDEIFPIDWTRVQSIFDKLGDDAVPLAQLAQVGQSLESGDFGMCMCYLGRVKSAVANGADVGIVWDKTYVAWDGLYAIKGSKSKDAQQAFLKYIATPEGQAGFSDYLPYGVTTTGDVDVDDETKKYLPTFNEDKISETYTYDVDYWGPNIDKAYEKWSEITAG